MKLIIRDSNGEIREQEVTADMEFTPSAGEQYFFTGVENYTFNLTSGDTTLDVHFLDHNGDRINVVLHNMAELIQQNDATDSFSLETAFGVSTNQMGDKAVDGLLNNTELESGDIVEALKDVLSMDGSTLAGGSVVDDFQGLLANLDATATGDVQNTAYNPLFDAVQTQEVDSVEESTSDRPDSYGDRDNSIERAEGSYGTETGSGTVAGSAANEDAQESVADTEADAVIASIDVGEANITSSIVDVEALRDLGYTVDNDGNFYEINDDAPKILVQQEFERDITKTVEAAPITKIDPETGDTVLDLEAMEAAGIRANETEPITLVQSDNINNIGNIGAGIIDGFNPEDTDSSQVFDFGSELANQMVTITLDFKVEGSWNQAENTTSDYFTISANDKELDTHLYSSTQDGTVDKEGVVNFTGSSAEYTHEYQVYLDENGQVQLDFIVATTASNEVIDIQNIEVSYAGDVEWVQDVTETETFTVTELVDAPATEVDPSDIPGGVPTITQAVEYPIDLMAKLTDTDGSESLSDITVDNLPEGSSLSGDNVTQNEDGSYTVSIDENGEANVVLQADSELEQTDLDEITAQVTATEENGDTSTVEVSAAGEFAFMDDIEAIDMEDAVSAGGDIHTINMDNETSQTLTVSADDILTSNDDHEMVILGNDGDIIDLEGEGWTKEEADVSLDGEEGTFDHYSSISSDGTSVDIYVNNDITVNTDDIF